MKEGKSQRLGLGIGLVTLALLGAGVVSAASMTPTQINQQWAEKIQSANDYEFEMDTVKLENGKEQSSSEHVWVKKPDMIRIRMDKGSHRGSEIIINSDGRVHAHDGGLLKGIKVSMSKNDSRLRDAQGDYAWQSDFATQCKLLHTELQSPEKAEAMETPDGMQLEVVSHDSRFKGPRKDIWVFDSNWVPVRHETFDGGTMLDKTVYHDFKENQGLKDSFFN